MKEPRDMQTELQHPFDRTAGQEDLEAYQRSAVAAAHRKSPRDWADNAAVLTAAATCAAHGCCEWSDDGDRWDGLS